MVTGEPYAPYSFIYLYEFSESRWWPPNLYKLGINSCSVLSGRRVYLLDSDIGCSIGSGRGQGGVSMSGKRASILSCVVGLMLLLSPCRLLSQMAGTGQIDGTVTDKSGGAVAGAEVTLIDAQTNVARTATTNDTGRYVFASVAPGIYTLRINKPGFRVAKFSDQQVQIGSTRTLNTTLELGATTETIEVTATSADLQTMNATVGNTITGVALNSLPTIGRDVSTFVTLQPGVAPDGSVAGAIYDQNSFGLDGGNNSNDMDGSMNVYTPSAADDTTGG